MKMRNPVALAVLALAIGVPPASGAVEATTASADTSTAFMNAYDSERVEATSEAAEVVYGVDEATADDVIADQEAVTDVLTTSGVEVGVDVDLWFEVVDGHQTVNVRTEETGLIDSLESASLTPTTDVVVVGTRSLSRGGTNITPEIEAVVMRVAPNTQGMFIRSSDGALVLDTTDQLTERQVVDIRRDTGFRILETQVSAAPAADSVTVRAGTAMSGCTVGFAARQGTTKGFYSAGHCGSGQRVYGASSKTGTSVPTTYASRYYNNTADVAFYSIGSTNTTSKTYYGQGSGVGNLGSPASVGDNTLVCHRGISTGWQCGRISTIAYRPTWSGACPGTTCRSTFVRVAAKQAPGDSGGPWLVGSRPIGIHKGGASTWSVYSKVNYVPSGTSLL